MKICVYTYRFGSYDALLDQDVAASSDADFICFTDDPDLRSDTWRTHLVEPRYPADLVRSARSVKILGHEALADYDVLLCIDASVLLRATPERIVADWLTDDTDLALARHSYRETVLDEFDEVVQLDYDDPTRVHEQLLAYSRFVPGSLEAKPLWTGMMVKRNTPALADTMRLWFDHVLRYSRRDQLSVCAVLERTGLRVRSLEMDNFESEYHRWPAIPARRTEMGKAPRYTSGPLLAELRRVDRRLEEAQRHLRASGLEDFAALDRVPGLRAEAQDASQRAEAAAQRADAERERAEALSAEASKWHQKWHETQGVRAAFVNLLRSFGNALRRRR